MQPLLWLALGYSVPVNPSKNRVYVWRKLKEYGAEYFKQGVAVLPKTASSLAQFRTLALKIREMGGDAVITEMKFLDKRDEAQMVSKFQRQSEIEYRELIRDCAVLIDKVAGNLFAPTERSDQMKRIAKQYKKVRSRDFFKSRAHSDINLQLDGLVKDMAHATDELARQLALLFSDK